MQCDPWGTCKLTWQHWHLFQQDSCQLLQNSPQAPKTILQGQVQGHIAVNGPMRLQAPKEEGVWYRGTAAANGQTVAATTSCTVGRLTRTPKALIQQYTVGQMGLHTGSMVVTCKHTCGMCSHVMTKPMCMTVAYVPQSLHALTLTVMLTLLLMHKQAVVGSC